MTITKFVLPPNQASYTVTDGTESISNKLDGGASRYRKDILNSTSTVKAAWLLSPAGYEYFRAFYKTATKAASLPFLLDLIIDGVDELTEHTCYFIPGSLKLSKVSGLAFSVECQLEVVPEVEDEAYNLILIAAFEEYGDNRQAWLDMINQLEQLANIDLDMAG